MLDAGHARWPATGVDMERAVRTPDGRIHAPEINRLVMWGISGGGRCALACAALLPELAAAAAPPAGPARYRAAGLGWFAGMGPADVDYNRLPVAPVGRLGVEGASDAVA